MSTGIFVLFFLHFFLEQAAGAAVFNALLPFSCHMDGLAETIIVLGGCCSVALFWTWLLQSQDEFGALGHGHWGKIEPWFWKLLVQNGLGYKTARFENKLGRNLLSPQPICGLHFNFLKQWNHYVCDTSSSWDYFSYWWGYLEWKWKYIKLLPFWAKRYMKYTHKATFDTAPGLCLDILFLQLI